MIFTGDELSKSVISNLSKNLTFWYITLFKLYQLKGYNPTCYIIMLSTKHSSPCCFIFWIAQKVPGWGMSFIEAALELQACHTADYKCIESASVKPFPNSEAPESEERLTAAEIMAPAGNKKVRHRTKLGRMTVYPLTDSFCTPLKRAGHFGASGCRRDRYRWRRLRVCAWEERLRKSRTVDTWSHRGVPRSRYYDFNYCACAMLVKFPNWNEVVGSVLIVFLCLCLCFSATAAQRVPEGGLWCHANVHFLRQRWQTREQGQHSALHR